MCLSLSLLGHKKVHRPEGQYRAEAALAFSVTALLQRAAVTSEYHQKRLSPKNGNFRVGQTLSQGRVLTCACDPKLGPRHCPHHPVNRG